MESTHQIQEDKACVECLEDPSMALNDLEGKELLSIAMSSYYLLYR